MKENFRFSLCGLLQGCSGEGTHGNGVPTPFSRFALIWV